MITLIALILVYGTGMLSLVLREAYTEYTLILRIYEI